MSSSKELENLVKSQNEQLIRYEKRLKDVVTAYKGLLKEKEALEAAISSSTKPDDPSEEKAAAQNSSQTKDDPENLKHQISTLMISLATLSGEKSRMEASFQADKKKLRNDLQEKDNIIKGLERKLDESVSQTKTDVESIKLKLIAEHKEREIESNNNMVMLRELQKLLSDERHLKESLEMQLNELKNQISSNSIHDDNYNQLLSELKEARSKIRKLSMQKSEHSENTENDSILQQLQGELQNMKHQHSIALKHEQMKREKLAIFHEDRVANLESRLAELSNTVGSYDRLRQQDQDNISKLKEKLSKLNMNQSEVIPDMKHEVDIPKIVEEIFKLKKIIQTENENLQNPFDLTKLLGFSTTSDHTDCIAELEKCQVELEDYKQAVEVQKHHIRTLQEKVKVLNRNIEDQEIELKHHTEKLNQAIKIERQKCRETISSLENEHRSKLNEIEQQLQKQRVRSLQLLEEKENEIKALKTSFEICVPTQISEDKMHDKSEGQGMSLSENCHMVHYANEIARKDVEISSLRKSKYAAESALRQALQDKITSQEELHDRIQNLEEQVDRLERCKTREGANLEYLKNVFVSFLSTRNLEGKRHMINAIGAVLQFTPSEIKAINSIFQKGK